MLVVTQVALSPELSPVNLSEICEKTCLVDHLVAPQLDAVSGIKSGWCKFAVLPDGTSQSRGYWEQDPKGRHT